MVALEVGIKHGSQQRLRDYSNLVESRRDIRSRSASALAKTLKHFDIRRIKNSIGDKGRVLLVLNTQTVLKLLSCFLFNNKK